jgi:hypothetical protein
MILLVPARLLSGPSNKPRINLLLNLDHSFVNYFSKEPLS